MQPGPDLSPIDRFARLSMVASAFTGDVTPQEVIPADRMTRDHTHAAPGPARS